jgi:hypothetical protein
MKGERKENTYLVVLKIEKFQENLDILYPSKL